MKVLIIGATGQIGQHVFNLLRAYSNIKLIAPSHEECSIENRQQVFSQVLSCSPNIIINTAAFTDVNAAEADVEHCFAVNQYGSRHLAQAADQIGAALIHVSTDYVFNGDKPTAYVETDATSPLNVYGKSKLAGEQEIIRYCSRYIILRTSWVFSEYGNNFVKTMLKLGQNRLNIDVVNDQIGAPTYAGDMAQAITQLVENIRDSQDIPFGLYHYCGAPAFSWYEFARTIFDCAYQQGVQLSPPILNPVSTKDFPSSVIRPLNSQLNCQRFTNTFGIQQSSWQNALKNLQAYLVGHEKHLTF